MQFTFLLDDIGIPANYRHMEGFGVHTYTLINKAGKVHYVKFHWLPTCGAYLSRLFGVQKRWSGWYAIGMAPCCSQPP